MCLATALLQVVKNACATQALLSVLLNVDHTHIELGSTLTDFKEFATSLDPAVCNRALGFSRFLVSSPLPALPFLSSVCSCSASCRTGAFALLIPMQSGRSTMDLAGVSGHFSLSLCLVQAFLYHWHCSVVPVLLCLWQS